MIVDDERLALDNLKNMINWEMHGFRIAATAANGKSAFQEFIRVQPQIVITDIKMPIMDGLELTEKIKKRNAATKILLLSAYSDFHYAKKAIEQGVADYVLKNELNDAILLDKLEMIKRQITAENKVSFMFMQKYTEDLFNTGSAQEDTSQEKFRNDKYSYIILQRDVYFKLKEPESEEDTVRNIIPHIMSCSSDKYEIIYAASFRKKRILIAVKNKIKNGSASTSSLFSFAEHIMLTTTEKYGDSFSAFVVYGERTIAQMYEAYKLNACKQELPFFNGYGKVYDFMGENVSFDCSKIHIDKIDLISMLRAQEKKKADNYISNAYEHAALSGKAAVFELTEAVFKILSEYCKASPMITQVLEFTEYIGGEKSEYEYLSRQMRGLYSDIMDAGTALGKRSFSREIVNAAEFIHEHYGDKSLCIDQISMSIGLSSARLSVKFKNETGITVNEFITDVRMKKAQYLLKQTEQKVYEIAESVGYSSGQYFSQLFQRMTGVTPAVFRRQ